MKFKNNDIKILIIILFFTAIISGNVFGQTENTNNNTKDKFLNEQTLPTVENLDPDSDLGTLFASKKDPFLAGFYSFFMMGAGHFYTGSYQKGSLFLFSDIMLKAVLVGMILHLKSEYTTDSQDSVRWRDLKIHDKSFVIGYSIVYIVILVLNVTDAVSSAHKYNRRYIKNPSFSFGFNFSDDKLNIALRKNF